MTHVRPFVRPLVRPLVRSGAVGPYGGTTYQDGIHLNFASGSSSVGHYVKAVGAAPTVSALTSLFTFTGGNQSLFRGPAGLLVASATNTPRIEYDANGNCLGLLMEAARTNLALQAQDLSTSHALAALLAFGSGSTVNAIAAPDGTTTADKIVEDTATTTHRIRQTTDVTIASGNVVSFSYFVKAAERTRCRLRITESTFASAYEVSFNLGTGTIGTATTTGVAVGSGSRMTALPNGWYRISISAAVNGGFLTARCLLELEDASGNNGYTGDGVSGLYAWGEQIEVGAFPSSYIPTTTVSVARTADSCARTLGSEYLQSAGTVVIAGRAGAGQDAVSSQRLVVFHDGTDNERIHIARPVVSDTARFSLQDGGANQATLDAGSFTNSTAFRLAFSYAANDMAYSFNGGAASTDAIGTMPTVTTLALGEFLGTSQFNGHILRFDYYPTRLPNTYLVSAST